MASQVSWAKIPPSPMPIPLLRAATMEQKRLEARILKQMNLANKHYGLIREGDNLLVALSGGKDSYAMLWGLLDMQKKCPFKFGITAYHLDQGQPGHDASPLEAHVKQLGVPYEIEYEDTYTKVVSGTKPGKIYCSLCSRFRRAILYRAAIRHGCNKVALGHHADDIAETLLLNIFFSGQLKTMPPKLLSDDGVHQIIRPLAYVPESDMINLLGFHNYPIMPCNLCGSQVAQRAQVKALLTQLEEKNPHIKRHILASTQNVRPSHLLDPKLHPFLGDAKKFETIELESQKVEIKGRLGLRPLTMHEAQNETRSAQS